MEKIGNAADQALKRGQSGELFKAETSWFHVFRSMIECGDVAKMGPYAVTAYLVIKSHTNFSTGRAFPAMETIVKKSGISLAQVKRAIKTLEEFGYIAKEKRGRGNVYALREKIELSDTAGRPVASASWDYMPMGVTQAMADLKNVLMSGDFAGAKIIQIERLNLQIISGSHNSAVQGVQVNTSPADLADTLAKLPPEWQAAIKAAKAGGSGGSSEKKPTTAAAIVEEEDAHVWEVIHRSE